MTNQELQQAILETFTLMRQTANTQTFRMVELHLQELLKCQLERAKNESE